MIADSYSGFIFKFVQSSVERTALRLYFVYTDDINFSSKNITSISGLLIMTTGSGSRSRIGDDGGGGGGGDGS